MRRAAASASAAASRGVSSHSPAAFAAYLGHIAGVATLDPDTAAQQLFK